jgi:pseudolysin
MKLSIFTLMCVSALPAFAAKAIDLSHQNINYLKSLTGLKPALAAAPGAGATDLQEISQTTDFNQTLHTRMKQTYSGYPVWGGDAVIHTPQGKSKNLRTLMASPEVTASTMNGTVYEGLDKDLQNTPAYVFDSAQADKAFNQAITDFESTTGTKAQVQSRESKLIVYVDANNKAHWAFHVSAYVSADGKPAKPVYIVDATDFKVYESWDDRKTARSNEDGGGFGGNERTGKLVYDGVSLAKLDIQRDAGSETCYLQNSLITVTDARSGKIASFKCPGVDVNHNNLYWNIGADRSNGGYSPNNDAMFAAKIISNMYQDWYHVPVLVKNGKPMLMAMVTHDANEGENAEWNDETETMYFGDGGDTFYPLTSLGVTSHEISHGFTSQHSNLIYKGESGGMNESFSDMADQAAKVYATGKNDWMIGSELAKPDDFALRYLDDPSKDCKYLAETGQCSVNTVQDYNAFNAKAKLEGKKPMNVHFSSGIYNRVFYLLATSDGWSVRKAFDVMVQANSHYWTANSTFAQGACGVLKAAKDYKYDTATVTGVFNKVGISTSNC